MTENIEKSSEKARHFLESLEGKNAFLQQSQEMGRILADWQCEDMLITAGLLYPLLSSDKTAFEKAEKLFDKSILKMIKGAMQMEIIHHMNRDQADHLRKMMLGMVDDIRTILLKLSERLFLIQDAKNKSLEIQQKVAQDTMDYYAPLANRLGLSDLKAQLEDGAFQYLHPDDYKNIQKSFKLRKEDREKLIHHTIETLKKSLIENNLSDFQIAGRIKHLYSIYKKILRKDVNVDHIYDTSAIRIILPTLEDCYTALGVIHAKWPSIADEFNDYIAKPKSNGYQSLHTAILLDNKTPIEIQIRTQAMHKNSELGIAAHWKYKENKNIAKTESEKILLLRELLDWQNTLSQQKNTAQLYQDAFHDRVYVFSPNSEVFDLPKGATPLDFAYLIHTNIGHRCKGAKVNGALVPLTYELKTGDHVDILTNKEPHPSHDWIRPTLGFLKTSYAIRKVKTWYRKLELASLEAVPIEDIKIKNATSDKKTADVTEEIIAHVLEKQKNYSEQQKSNQFSVHGAKNLLTQLAKCCHPIPGDEIAGYITKNRGISIHQAHCKNIRLYQVNTPERLIDITWTPTAAKSYHVQLNIEAEDRSNLLRDITGLISQLNLSISAIQSQVNTKDNTVYFSMVMNVKNLNNLKELIDKIRQVPGVDKVARG